MRYWLILAGGMVLIVSIGLYGQSRFDAGRSTEREASVKRANELIQLMEQDDAKITNMDNAAKCEHFGYRWLSDKGCY